jgi:hypothetical protein
MHIILIFTVTDVKCANENDDTLPRRLAVLRSWLLFLLGSLQEHLLGHILTTLLVQLDAALDEAKDLQSVLAGTLSNVT